MADKAPYPAIEADLNLAFDIGHSSIGWAVLRESRPHPEILGCGTVTFPADDCLASKRRMYRRQRRHVRSTRQRISRMERLLVHVGAMSLGEIEQLHAAGKGDPAPWLRAARLLAAQDAGLDAAPYLCSWQQLWHILRWYAHNRGYDGNRAWARNAEPGDDSEDDTQKVENARHLMTEMGRRTMAETIFSYMFKPHEVSNPLAWDMTKPLPFFTFKSRYKKESAAFPRDVVVDEVYRIIRAHIGHLQHCTTELCETLIGGNPESWRVIPVPSIKLPKRYSGSLLFGQLVPRFENRILSKCVFTGKHVPSKNTPEFYRYRWAMQVANISVLPPGDTHLRPLTRDERHILDSLMNERGYLTGGQLKKAVREITQTKTDNLDALLLHPDAEEALLVDPVKRLIWTSSTSLIWNCLPLPVQKRTVGKWRHGRTLTLQQIISWAEEFGADAKALVGSIRDSLSTRKLGGGKSADISAVDSLSAELHRPLRARFPSGRAPYNREIMKQAEEEVFAGFHPRKKCRANDPEKGEEKPADGCLVASQSMLVAELQRPLSDQTNNHLVRHRLTLLEKLVTAITAEYCGGNSSRIGKVTVEVNRELQKLSGKTAKAVAQDLGLRLSGFKSVVKKLEEALDGGKVLITPGLIRKARVAEDLNWTCPYTGQKYGPLDIIHKHYDKDHIIPRSQRPSDSLDSLVITTAELNKLKGNRSAIQFIKDMNEPEQLPLRDKHGIWTPREYSEFVEALDTRRGHDDDARRKRRRKELLLTPCWEENDSGFLPRDLTVTSQLVRLGAQMVRQQLRHLGPEHVTSMPGSVTGTVRNQWKLMGKLQAANPNVLDAEGHLLAKTEIRNVTHLHHALDACVLGLAAHYLPKHGHLWEAAVKRNPSREEKDVLRATGIYEFDSENRPQVKQLPVAIQEQIATCLAEKRVVQHIPAELSGLKIEENTRRLMSVDNKGRAKLRQRSRDPQTQKITVKESEESAAKLVGLEPGKLYDQKGVRVITDNFGVAILNRLPEDTPDSERFVIIPWHCVWKRLADLRQRNAGHRPWVLRQGQIIEVPTGNFQGIWRIFSVKNNASGMSVDMGWPDVVTLKNKTVGHKINVRLSSLIKVGMKSHRVPLTGLKFEMTAP